MHMADALISPTVGATMWATSLGVLAFSSKKISLEADDRKISLMGVLGAFIFAAQMINFTIPATGSSGHIGGGLLLSILLGPHPAFLVMASILTVQSLFFADGGLLALGCNIFNLGFFPCFIAYPFIYRMISSTSPNRQRIIIASIISAVIGLQLGSLGVVLQTVFSNISDLPFQTFLLLMQPIHLAIGIVEGAITAGIILFIWKSRPDILVAANGQEATPKIQNLVKGFLLASVVIGGVISWFASENPDGLEWAMAKTSGKETIENSGQWHTVLASLQEKIAFLPDYSFTQDPKEETTPTEETHLSAVNFQTSISGIVGGALVLLGLIGVGRFLRPKAKLEQPLST